MTRWTIQSQFVTAEVQSLGAMLGPAWFKVDGRRVQPFAIGPWAEDSGAEIEALPNILRRLRGEWPCVPFGIERTPGELPPDWEPREDGGHKDEQGVALIVQEPHGPSSNSHWDLHYRAEDSIEVTLNYPESHPVKRLTRRIRASSARPELEIRLQIETRTVCALPIGVHPTFRLPETPRQAVLQLGSRLALVEAWTSPVPLESHIARFQSGVRGVPLDRIPLMDGVEDITRLPLPYAAEEIVLTTGHCGRATLTNIEEDYSVVLRWDPEHFPACQLWLSNRGREYYPWNNSFLALGIEPIRAAFDFGTRASQNRLNPLWRAGIACTLDLASEKKFETVYRIAVKKSDPARNIANDLKTEVI